VGSYGDKLGGGR